MTDAPAEQPKKALTILPFNLNAYIYVQLTPAGRAYHAMQHAMFNAQSGRSIPYHAPHENAQGWSRWTCWQFMHEFGDQMFNGNPEPVCNMNILLDFVPPGA